MAFRRFFICAVVLLVGPAVLGTDLSLFDETRKWGFLGKDDEELRGLYQEADAVFLGCTLRRRNPAAHLVGGDSRTTMTVVDSYKGPYAVGDIIELSVKTEHGISEEDAVGRLYFVFAFVPGPEDPDHLEAKNTGLLWVDAHDVSFYREHGERLRTFLSQESVRRKQNTTGRK